MRKIKSTIWDRMHYYFGDFNDHSMRAVIVFDGKIDTAVLTRALNMACELVPIVKSRFVVGMFSAYWKVIRDFDAKDYLTISETDDPEGLSMRFVTGNIEEKKGAQLKVLVARTSNFDTLCVMCNHMCFDGRGFKDFLELIATAYNGLLDNKDFRIEGYTHGTGNRAFSQLYKNFSAKVRRKLAFRVKYGLKNDEKVGFPYEACEAVGGKADGKVPSLRDNSISVPSSSAVRKEIVRYKMSDERFAKLRASAKKLGVTFNDVLTASFGRAILDLNPDSDLPAEVDNVVDLRRYIKSGNTDGFTNMVSKAGTVFPRATAGEPFAETAKWVSAHMNKLKDDYMGMDAMGLLRFAFAVLPGPSLQRFVFRHVYTNPLTMLSNIGVFDEKAIAFRGLNVTDFLATGAIKYAPYFLQSLHTFAGHLSFASTVVGTEKDIESARKIYELMEKYFSELIQN